MWCTDFLVFIFSSALHSSAKSFFVTNPSITLKHFTFLWLTAAVYLKERTSLYSCYTVTETIQPLSFTFFLNSYPRICLLILEREEGREGEEKHQYERETWQLVTSCMHPTGIEPTTF